MSLGADFAAADDLFAEAFGEEVTLLRGAAEVTGVTAELTSDQDQGQRDDQAVETFVVTDFAIAVEDYDFGEGPVEPRRGDRIKRKIGDVTHTYEVLPIPAGNVCRRTPSEHAWLIHTKHIDP